MLNSCSCGTGSDEPQARVIMSPLDKEGRSVNST